MQLTRIEARIYLLSSRCTHGQSGVRGNKQRERRETGNAAAYGTHSDGRMGRTRHGCLSRSISSAGTGCAGLVTSVLHGRELSQSESSCAAILAGDRTRPDDRVILVMIDCSVNCNSDWLRHDLQWTIVGRVLLIISWPCTSSIHKDCGFQERAEASSQVPSCQFMRTVLLAKR